MGFKKEAAVASVPETGCLANGNVGAEDGRLRSNPSNRKKNN